MSHLRELKNKRLTILEKILQNQNLCKLLYYDGSDTNPLELSDIEDTTSLIGSRIFLTPFIPINFDTTINTLNIFFGKIQRQGTKYKDIEIIFLINCHQDNWILHGMGDLRPDLIAAEIEDMFNSQKGYGIGQVFFNDIPEYIRFADKFWGYKLRYTVSEWN